MGETPTSIFISCIVVVILIFGSYLFWTNSFEEKGLVLDESFADSMDKSSALIDQYKSMDNKTSSTIGMYDSGTGSLLFDGLNSIVLGLRATRAVISDFTESIGTELRINPIIIKLIGAILIIVLIAAIISALWSRDI